MRICSSVHDIFSLSRFCLYQLSSYQPEIVKKNRIGFKMKLTLSFPYVVYQLISHIYECHKKYVEHVVDDHIFFRPEMSLWRPSVFPNLLSLLLNLSLLAQHQIRQYNFSITTSLIMDLLSIVYRGLNVITPNPQEPPVSSHFVFIVGLAYPRAFRRPCRLAMIGSNPLKQTPSHRYIYHTTTTICPELMIAK